MAAELAYDDHSQSVYDQLRDGLISGRWTPGARLIPLRLKAELGCTTAALREALLRLSGEGFVETVKNLGFRAARCDEQTFREAAHLRLLLEREAAELAVTRGDFDWEMRLNAAHHQLNYIETQMAGVDDITPFLPRWSHQDWLFHSTLLGACGSILLMRNYKLVYDTFRMYAVAEFGSYGFGGELTLREHEAIYLAAIDRDTPALIDAIEAHLTLYRDANRAHAFIQSPKTAHLARVEPQKEHKT